LKTVAAVKMGLCSLSWNVSPDPETGFILHCKRHYFERSQHEIMTKKTTNELKAILNASEFSIIAVDVDGTVKSLTRELKFYWDIQQKNW
jgi:sensor histidine kinase regulating citrate/malate metabolism